MKKVLALILALAMCLAVCACGNSGNSESPNAKVDAQQSAQKTNDAKPNKAKGQSISLGEEIALDFVSFTFDSVELSYSVGGSGFSTVAADGMRCLSLVGTVENTGGTSISVGNVCGEMTFNGEYTYQASATIDDSNSFPVCVAPLAKAEYVLYVQIPEALLDRLVDGEARFSFNDGFATTPNAPDKGDHTFVMTLSEDVCKAALEASRQAKFFFKECPALPTPENYAPVRQSSSTTSSRNGVVTSTRYWFAIEFGRSESISDIYSGYLENLQQSGFTVSNDTGSGCDISLSGTKLASLAIDSTTLRFELLPGNESVAETSPAQAPEPAPTIEIGQTVETADYEFTLKKVELSYEILPPNTRGVYTSYPAESGKVYVHVEADVKNTMPRDIRISELFTASVLYDGKYPYSGYTIVNDGDNSFDWVSSYVAATPLETCVAHSLVECPSEVDTSGKPILVQLTLGNTTYEYTLR